MKRRAKRRDDRIPSIIEMRRMPEGERGPRVRMLADHYVARAAAATSTSWRTRHENALAQLVVVAALAGVTDLASA